MDRQVGGGAERSGCAERMASALPEGEEHENAGSDDEQEAEDARLTEGVELEGVRPLRRLQALAVNEVRVTQP